MINEELREELSHSYPEALLFDNPSYDNSIIGISHNGRIIYSFEKMIEELCKEDNIEQDEAIDFISYNTEGLSHTQVKTHQLLCLTCHFFKNTVFPASF